ncbi:MAG: AAA family ATPase [Fimbriimonadaceae bacterium]|nr:AAA family ATPase [Fimbriimonadaceae bacterium]
MQIVEARIQDFRGIEQLDLDFTDSLGRIRPLALIAGPNASGKTSILDALSICCGAHTGTLALRPDWELRPATVVRHGRLRATVECVVRFDPAERQAIAALQKLAGDNHSLPTGPDVTVRWEYPDPQRQSSLGRHSYAPRLGRYLFPGRRLLATLIVARLATVARFAEVGGVFMFDQRRQASGAVVPQDVWNILQDLPLDFRCEADERRTGDLGMLLRAMAVDAAVSANGAPDEHHFAMVQEAFGRLCSPHRWLGVRRDDQQRIALRFACGDLEYDYDGLSSGQQALLLFIARLVRERVHRSVVLIDELELHQHPRWQQQLAYALPRIGQANQFIATTHSPQLRDVFPEATVLGDLGEAHVQPAEVPDGHSAGL